MSEQNHKVWEMADGVVHSTHDYNMFNTLEDNREIDSDNENNIIGSVGDVGLIPAPVIVNEKYEVVDGQHRLEVCKKLGLPVFYLVVPGLSLEECIQMNINSKKWVNMNYIKTHAGRGKDAYIRILKLKDKYGWASEKNVMMAAFGHEVSSKEIREGNLQMSDEHYAYAQELLSFAEAVREKARHNRQRVSSKLAYVSMFSYQVEKVDVNRLMDVISSNTSEITKYSKYVYCFKKLADIYNKGLTRKAGARIRFDNVYEDAIQLSDSWYRAYWDWDKSNKVIKKASGQSSFPVQTSIFD